MALINITFKLASSLMVIVLFAKRKRYTFLSHPFSRILDVIQRVPLLRILSVKHFTMVSKYRSLLSDFGIALSDLGLSGA